MLSQYNAFVTSEDYIKLIARTGLLDVVNVKFFLVVISKV